LSTLNVDSFITILFIREKYVYNIENVLPPNLKSLTIEIYDKSINWDEHINVHTRS